MAVAGCQRDSADSSPAAPTAATQNEAAARTLLAEVIAAYQKADRYHDDARIVVRYRMNGQPMEEHQLWAVDFQRPDRLAARLFNARLQSDGERTTVMVFDFESQNMDNQYWVHRTADGSLWPALFDDPVCRHFVSGSAEIPFQSRLPLDLNLPPTIGLLTRQPEVAWLARPEQVDWLPDANAGGRAYRRVQIEHERRRYELWIDPDTRMIARAVLPNQFLDEQLLIATEITDLRLEVQFVGGTFDPQWAQSPFHTDLPAGANPVSRFVPLPEPFPSEAIGHKLPPLEVTAESGEIARWSPTAATTVIAWVDRQDSSRELIRELEQMVATSADQPVRAQLLFVEFPDANPQIRRPLELPNFVRDNEIRLPAVSDVGFTTGKSLGIKFPPTALVVDPDGIVQFMVQMSASDWKQELRAAIERIQAGEKLSQEMRAEYSRFVDAYRENLARLNPFRDREPIAAQAVSHRALLPARAPGKATWSFSDVNQPGNLCTLPGNRLAIHDGWQTIVELDLATMKAQRRTLNLAEGMGVTCLRGSSSGPNLRIAAFAEMGSQLIVVEDAWHTRGSLLCPDGESIRDVQVADLNRDGVAEVWWLDGQANLREYDDQLKMESRRAAIPGAESFVVLEPAEGVLGEPPVRGLAVLGDGHLVPIDEALNSRPPIALGELKIRKLASVTAGTLAAVGTALDERGQWQAIGIDRRLELAWQIPLGPQDFEQAIQPIASLSSPGGKPAWAFAASDNTIAVLDDQGRVLDTIQWENGIRGIALTESADAVMLVVSDDRAVTAVPLAEPEQEPN
jgi:DNA/RNA-binding domain of Phe-tRNA-synthetase-like protein